MQQSEWDPKQYQKFRAERSQPFYDLLDMVEEQLGMKVVDLGCGTGELTWVLHTRLEAAETLGLDNSETMLGKGVAAEIAGLEFTLGSIQDFDIPDAHLLFANASLQWVPDHVSLFAHLTQLLSPGGQIAVQVPCNDDHPAYMAAAELAQLEPFRTALGGYVRKTAVLPPEDYAILLRELGYIESDVFVKVYVHSLPNRDAVAEWVKGSLLTAYKKRMDPATYETFEHAYRGKLRKVLSDNEPFLFSFKRIFMWGRRGEGTLVTL